MPGSEASISRAPSSLAAEDDEEADYYYKENMKEAEMLTIERAQVFAARALQDHQIKVSGTTDFVTENDAVFVSGTAVMAMVTEEAKEREYQASKQSQLSVAPLTWYIKAGEVYCWCTRPWHSVTIGGEGFEVPKSARSQRSSSSQPKGPTYKVGDKVLVPVPGTDGTALCQVSAICVVLPKKEALVGALANQSQADDGPPTEFLEHFNEHEGEVENPMVFLYLSHKELDHDKFDADFSCLHSVEEVGEVYYPSVVVRVALNSDLIYSAISHKSVCCVPLFRCSVLRRSTERGTAAHLRRPHFIWIWR